MPVERRRVPRNDTLAGAALAAVRRVLAGAWEFLQRVYDKAGQDNVFFLAGGIAYNFLLAVVPFLLLLVAVFGYVLSAVVEDPRRAAVDYVFQILPPSQRLEQLILTIVNDVLQARGTVGILGLFLLVWTSTRLIGTLRAVLKDIFDLPEERGIVEGKLFDLAMVLVAGSLFAVNTGITVVLAAAQGYGVRWLGLSDQPAVQSLQAATGRLLAYGFIFLMFLLIYRFLPKRRTPWRMALVAASFTAVAWELLKGAFAWYVGVVPNLGAIYGTLVTPVILILWMYYSALVFILGGEVAFVADVMRIRRRQRELLE